jgi:hypothetical protein
MTIQALGTVTIGEALPGVSTGFAAAAAGIQTALPELAARLASLTSFQPTPLDFGAQLALANQIVGGIQLAMAAGVQLPDVSVIAAQIAALVAQITAQLALVQANLSLVLDLQAALGGGSVGLYAFDGQLGSLGGELTSQVGSSSAHAQALVMLTTEPATWAALAKLAKVSP